MTTAEAGTVTRYLVVQLELPNGITDCPDAGSEWIRETVERYIDQAHGIGVTVVEAVAGEVVTSHTARG